MNLNVMLTVTHKRKDGPSLRKCFRASSPHPNSRCRGQKFLSLYTDASWLLTECAVRNLIRGAIVLIPLPNIKLSGRLNPFS